MSDHSGLVDETGRPITRAQIAALREEISPIGGQYARPPFAGHLAFGIDPGRLGGIIRAADNGSTQEWMILAQEIEELFPHYSAVLGKRRRQVAQLPITVNDAEGVAGAKKHGDLVRAWLETRVLQRALFDVLDAVGKGFSVHEIIWETEPGRIRPASFEFREARHFEVSWEDGKTIWLRSEQGFQGLVPHKFLLHAHRSKSGMIVRSGLTRLVAFLWMYSVFTLKDWALFVQGYGLPIRLGRYGPEASDNDKRVLWRAVSSIAGDVAAIIPKTMEIEIVKGVDHAGGKELYGARLDWLNGEVSKLVLGSTAGTEAIAGSHAVGKTHREAEADVERFDAFLLETSIDRQVIAPMVAFTFGEQASYPTVTIGQSDLVPLTDLTDAMKAMGPMGLKVKAQQIRERLQMEEPEDSDETVGGVPATMTERVVVQAPDDGSVDIPNSRLPGPGIFSRLLTMQAEPDRDAIERLTARLAKDAAGALHGMTEQVRAAFDAASDMHDLGRRLHALHLQPDAFAEAMARGMALAQLVGQAAVVDELRGPRRP